MAVFAVHLSGDDVEAQAERLLAKYPGSKHFRVSERFYLVRADVLSNEVADRLGFDPDTASDRPDAGAGSVFKLNTSYAGWDKRTMWEWLGERE